MALAQAGGDFVVGNIRVEGLQRITEGTVYNYLPVNIGDRLDPRGSAEAIRALYDTGFFRDVEVRRDGSTLVVAVLERPSIESFEITGNKDIKTEDLTKLAAQRRPGPGKTFDRSVLDEVTSSSPTSTSAAASTRCGRHQVEELPGNRVKVKINIKEGKRARIRQINLVGNQSFDEDTSRSSKLRDAEPGCPGTGRTTAIRASRCRATSRSCVPSTWTAATRTSTSNRPRWRSRPRRTTSSSPSTSPRARCSR
jgi:outer membrane protein insertion porin family